MRRMLTALFLLLCLAAQAQAQAQAQAGASPADRAAIRQVIASQIAAFAQDDATAAFGFAAPDIKARFGDAPHFLRMVREAYPAVFRPRSFSFGTLAAEGRLLVQHLELIGPDGDAALALYSMEHEPDGSWRVGGCSLVTDPHLDI